MSVPVPWIRSDHGTTVQWHDAIFDELPMADPVIV
jgi:hypothetical protein